MSKLPKIIQDKIANEMYAAAEKDRRNDNRNYLGMSQIGHECKRKLWLDFRQFSSLPPEGRVLMLFRFGDRIEEEIIYHLNLAGYQVEGQQDGFSDFNGYFRGHCDGTVYNVTSKPHILECKSCNSRAFKSFQSLGVKEKSSTYYAQCQCYMGYSGLERALVVVQCKDNSELYTERIYFNKFEFEDLKKKAESIIFSDLPPLQLPPGFTCNWCDQEYNCQNYPNTIFSKTVCANCNFLKADIKEHFFFCTHDKHKFKIKQWGIGCPDWERKQ